MIDRDIRWYALVPTAVLSCFLLLILETGGAGFTFPARPNILWCLVFIAVLRVPAANAVYAFAVVGLIRDLVLGPRLGAGMAAFLVAGWFTLYWRLLATVRGMFSQILMVLVTALLLSLVKHGLDYGFQAPDLVYRVVVVSFADAALTAVSYPFVVLFLTWKPFQPWRERGMF